MKFRWNERRGKAGEKEMDAHGGLVGSFRGILGNSDLYRARTRLVACGCALRGSIANSGGTAKREGMMKSSFAEEAYDQDDKFIHVDSF